MRIEEEMQPWGPLTHCWGKQVAVRAARSAGSMGLETWTGEEELGADEEEQPGAEEVALERKKQL